MPTSDAIKTRASLADYVPLATLAGQIDPSRTPVTIKILLENVLHHTGLGSIRSSRQTS